MRDFRVGQMQKCLSDFSVKTFSLQIASCTLSMSNDRMMKCFERFFRRDAMQIFLTLYYVIWQSPL